MAGYSPYVGESKASANWHVVLLATAVGLRLAYTTHPSSTYMTRGQHMCKLNPRFHRATCCCDASLSYSASIPKTRPAAKASNSLWFTDNSCAFLARAP